jgi:hypothetical protein
MGIRDSFAVPFADVVFLGLPAARSIGEVWKTIAA